MKAHKKHVALHKPGGRYHRCEISVLGTSCKNINDWISQVVLYLRPKISIGYLDALHDENFNYRIVTFDNNNECISILNKNQIDDFGLRNILDQFDILFINGNHYESERQIVIADINKEKSLLKRINRLNNVVAIILMNSAEQYMSLLKSQPFYHHNIPEYKIGDIEKVSHLIAEIHNQHIPSLLGVVLDGGESTRMGTPKGDIKYYGVAHSNYLGNLLNNMSLPCVISCSENRKPQTNFQTVQDTFTGLGPLGSLLTLFSKFKNTALLTVACDMPFVDLNSIEILLKNRDPSCYATSCYNRETGFPEPLFTIWEPRMYGRIMSFIIQGYSCPRKVLINSKVKLIDSEHQYFLRNANTIEEKNGVISQLNKNSL